MKRAGSRRGPEQGYMLLSVLLVMTLMLVALSIELPRISQQIKREKEEELVHRGREYAMAVKRFYHKRGTYPVSLDQLESTNNLRFLRRRYKDPMTEKGEWKLVHAGEAQVIVPSTSAAANNNQGSGLTTGANNTGGANTAGNNNSQTPDSTSGFGSNQGTSGISGFGSGGLGSGNQGSMGSGSSASGSTGQPNSTPQGNQPGTGQMGTLSTQNISSGLGSSSQGGGVIIGVASTSKKTAIKEFNNSNEYDQWFFVYDPRVEQAGAGGIIIASPTGAAAAGSSSGNGSGDSIPQPIQGVRAPAPSPSPTPQ